MTTMKTRTTVSIVAGIAIFSILLAGALWYIETRLPNHGAASLVRPSMTRTQVVNALGVMYDDSKRGEYPEVDDVILKMNDSAKIKRVCNWRIAFSSDQFWVGLDAEDNVVATYLEKPGP
jgi:hypothetical protein